MNKKRNIIYFIFGIFSTSIILVGINYIIDPFQIYHKANFHKTIFMKGFYLNAGLIKNYDYDSVSIGSSMTQNFIVDEIKNNLNYNKPIKLPVSGGNIIEHYTVLESAISTNKVKKVLFGLDIFSLKNSDNRLPTFLYDNNIVNDYKYLFSIDTLKRSLTYPMLHLTIPNNHPRLDYNLMFQWQHNHKEDDFNESKLRQEFEVATINFDNKANQATIINERITNFNKYITPIIENNKDIEFTFFYPPYSVLSFKKMSHDTLNAFIETKIKLNEIINRFDNAKIHDFQTEMSVITNLGNYKDLTHYHQKVNSWMLEQMREDNYLIDSNVNYSDFKKNIINFD